MRYVAYWRQAVYGVPYTTAKSLNNLYCRFITVPAAAEVPSQGRLSDEQQQDVAVQCVYDHGAQPVPIAGQPAEDEE